VPSLSAHYPAFSFLQALGASRTKTKQPPGQFRCEFIPKHGEQLPALVFRVFAASSISLFSQSARR
jgi:hypothetical protein